MPTIKHRKNKYMEVLYSTTAVAVGGRDGHVESMDGALDLDIRTPKEMGGPGGTYTNPEQLFAAGYAACFNSAIQLAARLKHIAIGVPTVTVQVDLGRNDESGFKLSAHIVAEIPRVSKKEADELVQEAHRICPYSNATRGNMDVEIHARIQ